jgi:hypothetical protein
VVLVAVIVVFAVPDVAFTLPLNVPEPAVTNELPVKATYAVPDNTPPDAPEAVEPPNQKAFAPKPKAPVVPVRPIAAPIFPFLVNPKYEKLLVFAAPLTEITPYGSFVPPEVIAEMAVAAVIAPVALSVVNAPVLGVDEPMGGGLTKLSVPPSVKLPEDVTVPESVIPETVPVPLTLETVAPVELLDANKVTVPALFFAYSFMSAMFSASSPLARLPAVGTAEDVVL